LTAPSLAEFLDRISAGRDGVPISIDEAQQVSGLNRSAVLERFRRLQSEGEGYLRLGRHGHPTRFYFRSSSSSSAMPGTEPASSIVHRIEAIEGSPMEGVGMLSTATAESGGRGKVAGLAEPLVEHQYRLRADLCITISLPSDLSEREAGRVARFIETLPL